MRPLPSYDLGDARLETGEKLSVYAKNRLILLVFLRHLGCLFCREMLGDLARQRPELEARNATIVLVHMAEEENAAPLLAKYGADDLPRVSDPERVLYRAFGLAAGRLEQLIAPTVWVRGLVSLITEGHRPGTKQGDGRQMPGVFVLRDGAVLNAYRHQRISDRPQYLDICCPPL